MSLEGKRIFVTGGTGGIGRPLVARLRGAGAEVTVYDSRKEGDLVSGLDRVCGRLNSELPDILIMLAGANHFGFCEDQDLERLLDLNLLAPMRLIQAVLPGMKARRSGQIVTVGSMSALIPLPHVTGYVAAKAGLKAFQDALRRELQETGIALTHIAPRAVQTAMNDGPQAEANRRAGIKADDPDRVADRIFQAIRGRQREVRIGWPERLFAMLNANFPGLIDRGLRKIRGIGEAILEKTDEGNEPDDEKSHSPLRRPAS